MTPEDFDDAFLRERPRLIRFLMGLGAKHDEAEDIVQECWLNLRGKTKTQYQELGHFPAWIRRCCYNKFLDYRRRGERGDHPTEYNVESHDKGEVSEGNFPFRFSGKHPSSFQIVERLFPSFKLFRERVSHCFDAHVPDQYRPVIRLMLEQGISPGDAADALGLPSKTTDNALRYRLRSLRTVLFDCICVGGIAPFT